MVPRTRTADTISLANDNGVTSKFRHCAESFVRTCFSAQYQTSQAQRKAGAQRIFHYRGLLQPEICNEIIGFARIERRRLADGQL